MSVRFSTHTCKSTFAVKIPLDKICDFRIKRYFNTVSSKFEICLCPVLNKSNKTKIIPVLQTY